MATRRLAAAFSRSTFILRVTSKFVSRTDCFLCGEVKVLSAYETKLSLGVQELNKETASRMSTRGGREEES